MSSMYDRFKERSPMLSGGGSSSKMGDVKDSLVDLMGDRNIQSLMAGMGRQMDPEGAGEFLGAPAQADIQSRAAQEQQQRQDQMWNKLIEALGGKAGKVKVDKDGGISAEGIEDQSGLTEERDVSLGGLGDTQTGSGGVKKATDTYLNILGLGGK